MKNFWNRFFVNFLNGMVILLPVVVTIGLIRFLMFKLNDIVLNPIMRTIPPVEGGHHIFIAKLLIFFAVIFAIAMIGWGAKILFIKRIFVLGERLLIKVPVMGRIYNAAKQIFSALLGQGRTIFKQVVMLEYPRKGLYTLGFTTGTTKGELKGVVASSSVNVFVPTTPNPTSGFFLVVPTESLRFLKMSVEDGMKMIISGGSVSPWTVDDNEDAARGSGDTLIKDGDST